MGGSAREIERQITETRERIDANLARLEIRAAYDARRYGLIAVVVLGIAAVGVVGALAYWKKRR